MASRRTAVVVLWIGVLLGAPAAAAIPGDADRDGDVDGRDVQIVADNFGRIEEACVGNDECGDERFCLKPPGQCRGEGVCANRPDGCVEIYDPVCGCDGHTYSNRCFAAVAGVNVAHPGECREECSSNAECAADAYCRKRPGDCRGLGLCADRPDACPRIWDPVCGCDGETYPNACDAAAAGVNVLHEGACRRACRGNADCPADDYCAKEPGDCRGVGECADRPRVCPDLWDPVCGCDGETYPNACEAAAAGASVAHEGECGGLCGGIAGLPCPEGMVCNLIDPTCQVADLAGRCVPLPEACPDLWEPVCGCDGVTYPNDCVRIRAGATLAHPGRCERTCLESADCPSTQYCATEPGQCGQEGVCAPRPEACEKVYRPVCGCDGVTYGNPCLAARAGASIAHAGPCESPCKDNSGCSEKEYCRKELGDCDGPGVCAERPRICPLYADPVCGCDGRTYSNPCDAAAAGVNVARKGPCRSEECDDGTALLCMMPGVPGCGDHEVLAIQNHCWVCVNPATCRPWGEPGCRTSADCGPDETCDPCGTSSCPFCDDCVPACVP
ncbi:MAG: hypothetical protein Kow0092_37780 [Deferrisomatales bacterium]